MAKHRRPQDLYLVTRSDGKIDRVMASSTSDALRRHHSAVQVFGTLDPSRMALAAVPA